MFINIIGSNLVHELPLLKVPHIFKESQGKEKYEPREFLRRYKMAYVFNPMEQKHTTLSNYKNKVFH